MTMRFFSLSSKSIARALVGCSEVFRHLNIETVSLQKSVNVQYSAIFYLDLSEMNCFYCFLSLLTVFTVDVIMLPVSLWSHLFSFIGSLRNGDGDGDGDGYENVT